MSETAATALQLLANLAGIDLSPPHRSKEHVRAQEHIARAFSGARIVTQRSSAPTAEVLARASGLAERATSDFGGWLKAASNAKGCTRPIRLAGTSTIVNAATGEVVSHFDTSQLPGGIAYKPCGNRRERACPACSQLYKYDTYQLIKAGLAGGKGVPESVASHPAIFLTLTAPSFGPVHTRIQRKRGGPVTACAPYFRTKPVCQHGRPLYCAARHHESDTRIGKPLCAECYDHNGHVIFNHFVPQLWARTTIAWSRALTKAARAHGTHVKVRFAKVAEFQHRGLVHIHALLRLDGHDPDQPSEILSPPACVTAEVFKGVVKQTVAAAALQTPPHPDRFNGWTVQWGRQIDVRIIRTGLASDFTENHVAGYLAKYATKSTEITGLATGRLTPDTVDRYADPDGSHTARLVDAAWTLGRPSLPAADGESDSYDGLRRGAHQYGFGGHFSTKSRYYSTTLTRLRNARRTAAIRGANPTAAEPGDLSDQHSEQANVVLGDWTYHGTGWQTTADAALAAAAAAAARERQPAASANNPSLLDI